MSPHWSTRYIGLPYRPGGRGWEGVDCWGLVHLFYATEKGVHLPELPGMVNWNILEIIHSLVQGIKNDWVQLERPVDGCAVVMSMRTIPHHVGIWTDADGGKIIHCWSNQPVVADTLRGVRAKGLQTIEFYGLHH